jgi:hypothetical protein
MARGADVASTAKLISILEGEIGYRESGSNDTKYNRWLGPISGYPHSGYGYPWCASFASWAYKGRKRWGSTPRVGAQVFYGPGGGTHTEIVVAFDAVYITTIGGNTGGSLGGTYYNGDGVYRKRVRRDESRVYGYGYPLNLEGDEVTKDDIQAIAKAAAEAVWNRELRAPDDNPANPAWRAEWHIYNLGQWVRWNSKDLKELREVLGEGPEVDPAALAEAIAVAVPADIAQRVVDELSRRLGGQ